MVAIWYRDDKHDYALYRVTVTLGLAGKACRALDAMRYVILSVDRI
jgi:hypothetical protein